MRRSAPSTPSSSQRRGSATVEFAVLVPLFLSLLLGTVEMGSAISVTQKFYSALREGGRLASMDYDNILASGTNINTKVVTDIRNFLKAEGLPGNDITITITHADGANAGQPFDLSSAANDLKLFKLTASAPYSTVSTFPLKRLTNHIVTASLTFRKGRVSLAG